MNRQIGWKWRDVILCGEAAGGASMRAAIWAAMAVIIATEAKAGDDSRMAAALGEASIGEDEIGFRAALKEALESKAFLILASRPSLRIDRQWELISFTGPQYLSDRTDVSARLRSGDKTAVLVRKDAALARCRPLQGVLQAAESLETPVVDVPGFGKGPERITMDGVYYQLWAMQLRMSHDPNDTDGLVYFTGNVGSGIEALMKKARTDLSPCW